MRRRTAIPIRAALIFAALGAIAGFAGCSERRAAEPVAGSTAATPAGGHTHAPLQGGVLAELGAEEYHLEVRHGDTPGVVQAFIMDGEVENFVRSDLRTFAARARVDGREVDLVFVAVANSATGEKVGDTSLFEAVTGLPGKPALTLVVPALTIKGHTYHDVTVQLPAKP